MQPHSFRSTLQYGPCSQSITIVESRKSVPKLCPRPVLPRVYSRGSAPEYVHVETGRNRRRTVAGIWEGSTDTSARRPYPKMNGTHDLFPPLTSTNTNTNYSSRKSHSSDYQRKKRQNRWLMSFFFPQAISSHGRIQNNGPSQSLLFALTVPAQGSSSQL